MNLIPIRYRGLKEQVMSCDIHPHHPHMLVCGLYDGSVAVYNLQQRMNGAPNYMSSATNGKHTDVVWQVGLFMRPGGPRTLDH